MRCGTTGLHVGACTELLARARRTRAYPSLARAAASR
uniref:Uncharacterized protein n=1 Tax=Rhizophora mucronata TaxID=61149 RepID=A0A2P2NDS4_RHIMU